MVLNNLRMALTDFPVNIRVQGEKIIQISPGPLHVKAEQLELNFDHAIVFPGLINSHDHLDFNLFPALGNEIYKSYTEWGQHIHKTYKDTINSVLNIPEALREEWGIYKNLLCGVTTVVNHGKKIKKQNDAISVFEDCQCIHSVQFEKKWMLALNNPFKKNLPVVIHVGEGTDPASFNEINSLIRRNFLRRNIVGVHGVAMNETQARSFKALVWCPESNYFLLNQTAPVNRLKKHLPVLFGTDSTLTGDWNIWDHIRLARKTKFLTDQELYNSLTINAADTWKLDNGAIIEGKDADLVVAKTRDGLSRSDAFFATEPMDILMVIHKGIISLFDEALYSQLTGIDLENYSKIHVNGTCKYVLGNLPVLIQKIKKYYPETDFPVI
ncbi:MAG: amidohydrolase family protein [Mucilaginibacter sp.]